MININLLPPELKIKRIAAKRNASLLNICVLIVLIFLVLGFIARAGAQTLKSNLDSTKNNLQKDSGQVNNNQDLQDLALFINDRGQAAQAINEKQVYWSEVLAALINSVPVNVQFENLTMKDDKTPNFVLQGNATDDREIIRFKEKLEESPFFKNVTFKSSSTSTDTTKTNKLTFTLEFDLEKKK